MDTMDTVRQSEQARVPAWRRLREKLPEILLEAASVVFAVLLALAVDEWRENRSRRAAAARAQESIVHEIRANRVELESTRKSNEAGLKRLSVQIQALSTGRISELTTGLSLAQFSSAAWQAAQSTDAPQLMDFAWLVEAAGVYETQRVYVQMQNEFLVGVSDIGSVESDAQRLGVMRRLEGRLRLLQNISAELVEEYQELERMPLKLP